MTIAITARDGGSVLSVRVQPGAGRAGVAGVWSEALRVRVSSPPVDGRANDEVCEVLAGALGVRTREVSVVGGRTARSKLVWVGLAPDDLRTRLAQVVSAG